MASSRVDPGGAAGTAPSASSPSRDGSLPTNGTHQGEPLPDSLGGWGLPPDVSAQVQRLLQQGYSIDEILAYIRGTDWYAQTYPGIQQGIALGLVSNEADYRAYLNQANQLYRRYYGRDISSQELAGFLTSGVSLSAINEQLQTGATYKTMFGDTIDPNTLTTILGSGISADSYLQIQASYRQLFGRDPTSAEVGLFLRSGANPGDLQSYNELFHKYGKTLDAETLAGLLSQGISPNTLAQQFQTQGDVSQLYRQYGQQAPGNAVSDILSGKTSLDEISKHLEGGAYISAYSPDIQQAMGQYGAGKLSGQQLTALGDQKAGYSTPLGFKLQRALDLAMKRMQGVFQGSLATQANLGVGRLGLSAPQNASPPDTGR